MTYMNVLRHIHENKIRYNN